LIVQFHTTWTKIVEKRVEVPYDVETIVPEYIPYPVEQIRHVDVPVPVEQVVTHVTEQINERRVPVPREFHTVRNVYHEEVNGVTAPTTMLPGNTSVEQFNVPPPMPPPPMSNYYESYNMPPPMMGGTVTSVTSTVPAMQMQRTATAIAPPLMPVAAPVPARSRTAKLKMKFRGKNY